MKFFGLDGKEYSVMLSSAKRYDENKSGLHLRAKELLKCIFPYDIIYEDITLPGTGKGTPLYADFFIPLRKIIIEVNGEQHFKHVHFYHKTKMDFFKSKNRDKRKSEWCEINGITLINLNYNQSNEQWEEIINAR